MASERRWEWDLEEMRNAAQMAEQTTTIVPSCTMPFISGFTPINRPQAPINSSVRTGSHSQSSGNLTRRGKSQASNGFTVDTKKRKGPTSSKSVVSKKPKSNQTTGRSTKKNISKVLQRTKPGLQNPTLFSIHKIKSPLGIVSSPSIDQSLKLPTSCDRPSIEDDGDTSVTMVADAEENWDETRHTSLSTRYQTECDLQSSKKKIDFTSASSHQKLVEEESPQKSEIFEEIQENEKLRFDDHPDNHFLIADRQSLFWHSDSPQDVDIPPSVQPPSVDLQEALEATRFGSEADCASGADSEINHSVDIDDSFGGDIDRHMANVDQFGESTSDFIEDTALDEKIAHELDAWPDDVSMPDAVTIYDEEWKLNPSMGLPDVGAEVCQLSKALHPTSGNINKAPQPRNIQSNVSENEFDDSELEASLMNINSPTENHQLSTPHTSPLPSSSPKLRWLPPKDFTPSKYPAKVPVTHQDILHLVPKNSTGKHLPFVRPPFPKLIRDRSPILGLTNTTVLRTCFRIGEALNAAAQASRSKVDAIVELYARVTNSSRDANGGFKQSFQFADLFTDKTPYLNGVSSIWKGVSLWDQDSRVFLGEAGRGKMCRVVGRVKKGESHQGGCLMTVLSIWEVDWEDVGIAKGIVCS